MEGAPQLQQPVHITLPRWAVYLIVAMVAIALFGPIAVVVLTTVTGVTLIGTGIQSPGWRRPAYIVIGTLVLLTPVLIVMEVAFGHTVSRVIR